MTIHAFPHRVASPASNKAPSTPPRIWLELGAQTPVQMAQLLARAMRRLTFGNACDGGAPPC